MACYNFDTHEQILVFFGRNVTDKVGSQKCCNISPQVTCASALPSKTGKHENHFSLKCCIRQERCSSWTVFSVLHAQCTSAVSSWKKCRL